MSFWDSLFGVSNPANAAQPYYAQVPGMLNQQYAPYQQGGTWAQGQLQGPTSQALSNPGQMVNQIGASYQASPGFNWQMQQAMAAGNQSAAAGGMAGSQQNQQQNMGLATQLADQNYNQQLQNYMGMFNTAYGGAQNMYGVGANAANQNASNQAQSLSQQGQNAYGGANWQNNTNMAGWDAAGGLLSKAFTPNAQGNSPASSFWNNI
jgi:hypothetical protein